MHYTAENFRFCDWLKVKKKKKPEEKQFFRMKSTGLTLTEDDWTTVIASESARSPGENSRTAPLLIPGELSLLPHSSLQ